MKLTTTNLRLPRVRAWWNLPTPAAAALAIFCLLSIGMLLGRVRSAQQAAAVPTPALPVIIIASAQPAPPTAVAPTPAAQVAAVQLGNVTVRAIGVFGAPDTASYIGSVEPGRTYQVLAKSGADWLQVNISGGTGVVFVRTADLFAIPADLVDLAPTPAPVVIERPVYVASPPQAAQDAAPTVSEPLPTLVPQQMVILDRQQWALDAQRAAR